MAKRKLGVSVIVLCIAVVTLISGTYAWFLVGGFANLFDIGFDVIEAEGGILLQGDEGTAEKGAKTWGSKLEREDFLEGSFITPEKTAGDAHGYYKPVSSNDAEKFLMVGMNNDLFISGGEAPKKGEAYNPNDICYNNFTFRIKSDSEEIVGSVEEERGAYMTIVLNGEDRNAEDANDPPKDGAAVAARVSVTMDGKTTIYSIDGQAYKAVTTDFNGVEIVDAQNDTDPKTGEARGNRIIDENDTNYTAATILAPQAPIEYKALREKDNDGNEKAIRIYFGNLPNVDSNGKEVTVKIWLEGNDPDCVDFADKKIAGEELWSYISFGTTT